MATPLRSIRLIGRSAIDLDRLTGEPGEIFLDKTTQTVRIFDGKNRGGIPVLRADLSNLETTGGSEVDFGSKVLVAQEFQGAFTGNVTGQVSSLANHTLSSLSGVNVTSAGAGSFLSFNGTQWVPVTLAGGWNGGEVSNATFVNNSTASTSTATGAFRVTGGVGVGGALYVGSGGSFGGNTGVTGTLTASGNITSTNGTVSAKGNITTQGSVTTVGVSSTDHISILSDKSLKLYNAAGTHYVSIKSPSTFTSDYAFTLPASFGTPGQFLQTNGSGGMSWVTVESGGGGGGGSSLLPGGSEYSVQYNSANIFAGSGTFTYDPTTGLLTVDDISATDVSAENLTSTVLITALDITVNGTISGDLSGDVTSSNVTITGGSINGTSLGTTTPASAKVTTLEANDQVTFTKATESNSATTGAVVVTGGVGIGQNTNIGGNLSVNNNVTVAGSVTVSSNVVINNLPTSTTHATNKKYVDSRAIAMSVALS